MYRSLALLLSACAATSIPRPLQPEPSPGAASADDVLVSLANELPSGADECVLARPERLDAARLRHYSQIALADPIAWSAQLRVRAFASATRRGDTARYVAVLQLDGSREQIRSGLLRSTDWDIAWDRPPTRCTPDRCPTSARFVAPGVVRLERGPWQAGDGVTEARCLQLARAHPDALEISARHVGSRAGRGGMQVEIFEPASLLPVRSSSVVRSTKGGVVVARVDVMVSEEAAERAVRGGLDPLVMGAAPISDELRRRREGTVVYTDMEVLFEDLQLREQDETRQNAGRAYAEALAELVPPEDVNVDDLQVLREQIRLYRVLIRNSSRGRHGDLLDALRYLLERGVAVHPDEADLRRALSDLNVPATPTPPR